MSTNINFGKSLGISKPMLTAIELPTTSPGFEDTTSFLYDGVDDYQESAGTWSTIDGATNFSISVWVKVTLGSISTIANSYETGTARNFYMIVTSTGRVDVWSAGAASNWSRSTTNLTDGVWHHIVMTLDQFTGDRYTMQKIYIDGVVGFTSNYYGGTIPTGTTLGIGANYNYSHPAYFYPANANINEFAVWGGHTLSPTEITEIYNNGVANDLTALPTAPSPTNWYREESAVWNGSYYETPDEMGVAPNLTTRNMAEASRVSDVPQFQTFSTLFDGVDDYVDISSNVSSVSSDNEGTVSVWIKTTDVTTSQRIICFSASTLTRQYLTLIMSSTLGFTCDMRTASDATTGFLVHTDTNPFVNNTWIHLAVVQDGVSPQLYVNGVAVAQTFVYDQNDQKWLNDMGSLDLINIGRMKTSNLDQNYFDGNIDEVAYFNTALSASDILDIYNGGTPKVIDSAVFWYRMGDGDVYPTLNDRGSSGNNGTMTNMTSASIVNDVP